MKKTTATMYYEILEELRSEKELSKILPSVLILANRLENPELIKWTELEMNSYFTTNTALTEDVTVPEYRIVAGQYFDKYQRPFIIPDSSYQFVNEYRLRHSVSELESLFRSDKMLSVQDSSFTKLIKQNFNVEVDSFSFNSTSIIGVIDAIKTNLINKLLAIESSIGHPNETSKDENEIMKIPSTLASLHPLIQPVAAQLYLDTHYRQAILDTYILLIETVKTKSGRHDLDGTALMQTVFSAKKPIIKISDDPDEQLGFLWMFSGSVMGIRNPKAHRLIQQTDPQRTLEWLSFASVLLRVLDDSEVIKEE